MRNRFWRSRNEFPSGCLVASSPQRSRAGSIGQRQRFPGQSCYYASQAAEKGLKGALLELGIEPPHTHVLNDLVQRLWDNGLNTDQLQTLPLRGLSRMAIQSRYPLDATPPSDLFDPADAEQALATAAEVLDILEALDQQG